MAAQQAPEPGDEHEDEKDERHPWPRREGGQHEDVISGENGVSETSLLPEGMPVGLFDPRMDDGEVRKQDHDRDRGHLTRGQPAGQVVAGEMRQENVEQRARTDRGQRPKQMGRIRWAFRKGQVAAREEQDQQMVRRDGQPRVLQAEPEYDHGDVGDEESEAEVHEVAGRASRQAMSIGARAIKPAKAEQNARSLDLMARCSVVCATNARSQ